MKNLLSKKVTYGLFHCMLALLITSSPSYGTSKVTSKGIIQTDKTVVIYLIGLAGTGKYTIAKKISRYGYKVVDNHLINNPIFSLIDDDAARQISDEGTEKVDRIRNIVLEFIEEDSKSNYVLTNQLLSNDYHYSIYNKILGTAEKRDSIFIPVVLEISSKERAKRIVQPERSRRFKIADAQEAYHPQQLLNIPHENLLELNVTNLSADEVAKKILLHIRKIKINS